ncbi:hypothetical protein GIB67_008894 [Kingdonia uniflora]|uniref:Uncharacterized protein n=1 Tax=Kingdonia uniflora TaxID=39325 RepID=A0A7J7LVM3_9MAGN|nr:hypothetical protein GIB67_008894 [Kingdonia uniflora]
MLKNEGSCNDRKLVLLKRYKAFNIESGNDASVLELRTVCAGSNKCQSLEREKINSASSCPIKRFTTSNNLESTQSQRRNIRGFDKELSEGDKRYKRVNFFGSRRWLYSSVVREKLDATADSHLDTEEFVFKMGSSSVNEVSTSGRMNESDNEGKVGLEQFSGFSSQLVSYPPGSDTFRKFCKAKAVVGRKWGNCVEFIGQTWNDNIIRVKGNCLQRDDEEPLDLPFRAINQSVKSKVERKESLLDEVAEEETELELVLEGLGLSRKKRVDSRSNKVRKAQSTRSMAGVDEGKKQVSGEEAQTNFSKTFGTGSSAQPNHVKPSKIALKYLKKRMLKALPASSTTRSGEVVKDKRRRVEPSGESGEKVAEGRSATMDDLKEVEERARLAALYGEEDTRKMVARLVKGIWLGIEEKNSELKKANVELENELAQSRTNTLKEVRWWMPLRRTPILRRKIRKKQKRWGSWTAVREMSLRINDLESGFARERETSKALLSAQAELQVEEKDAEINKGLKKLRRCNNLNERVARLKAELAQAIARAKKAEARECPRGSRTEVQKGNANLRECQHKLDDALIREKVLEGEIKGKELLMKKKEELLKDIPSREELNAKIWGLRARAVDLEAMYLAESTKYIKKYARLESRLEKVRVRFATMTITDVPRSDLLKAIVADFVEEVKRLE